jgi:hypothetical protein
MKNDWIYAEIIEILRYLSMYIDKTTRVHNENFFWLVQNWSTSVKKEWFSTSVGQLLTFGFHQCWAAINFWFSPMLGSY